MKYDIAVVGNDEGAFEMLNLAATARRRTVAIIPEIRHSAWLVAQALRRLTSNLLVDRTANRRSLFERKGTPRLLNALLSRAIAEEVREHIEMLERLGVDVRVGEAALKERNTPGNRSTLICNRRELEVKTLVVATGVRRTAMHRPVGQMPFHRPEALFTGRRLPKVVSIIGGGDFGAGLATLMSLFGVHTQLVSRCDGTSVMLELASSAGVEIGQHPADLGLDLLALERQATPANLVDCRRVVGYTEHLKLDTLGIEPDENGQLWCAGSMETWCSGVFGIGDVVGFSPDSALAPTVQAERVMNRITHAVPRPHLLREFARQRATA